MPGRSHSAAVFDDRASNRLKTWTQAYTRLPGIPDEFVDHDGHSRPHWRHMLAAFAAFDPSEMRQRFAAADRRIRSRGLSYRVAGEKDERAWPLGRIPLVDHRGGVGANRGRRISAGRVDRTRARRRLWRREADIERRSAGGGDHGLDGLCPCNAGREASRRTRAAPLRRRCRPWTRRRLVGVGRPDTGALGLRVRARRTVWSSPRRFPTFIRS